MRKLFVLVASVGFVTIIFGTVYAAVQQSYRQNANDPQIQVAQDTAKELNDGNEPQSLVLDKVDMAKSLASFVIVYDKQGQVVTGSGELDGKVPVIPLGVLQHASADNYNDITWEPKVGVRVATVTVAADNYYVLSGRSLKEIEKRVDQLTMILGAGWLASIVFLSAVIAVKRVAVRGQTKETSKKAA